MEIEIRDGIIWVVLSERNLRTLLNKMGRDGSKRTLFRDTEHGRIVVTAQNDGEHYKDRVPGFVLDAPETGTFKGGDE